MSRSENQRAQGRSGARCTRGLACKIVQRDAHEHTGSAEAVRPSLRSGFTAYNVLSQVTGLFCHLRLRELPFANLTPASGRQDHTTSPSASARFVKSRFHVHRIPCRVVDVAQRPLWLETRDSMPLICPTAPAKYFCSEGWTENADLPVRLIKAGHCEEVSDEPTRGIPGSRSRTRAGE